MCTKGRSVVGGQNVRATGLSAVVERVIGDLKRATYWDYSSIAAIQAQLERVVCGDVLVAVMVTEVDELVKLLVGERDVEDVWRINRSSIIEAKRRVIPNPAFAFDGRAVA